MTDFIEPTAAQIENAKLKGWEHEGGYFFKSNFIGWFTSGGFYYE